MHFQNPNVFLQSVMGLGNFISFYLCQSPPEFGWSVVKCFSLVFLSCLLVLGGIHECLVLYFGCSLFLPILTKFQCKRRTTIILVQSIGPKLISSSDIFLHISFHV